MWRGPIAVAADPALNELLPQVAVDGNGNAVVVYDARRRDLVELLQRDDRAPGERPAPSTRVPDPARSNANIAVDKNGGWLAVWAQNPNGTLKGIYTSSSTNGTTWSAITPLTNTTAWTPVLAMNADGAAIVAWTESVGNPWQAAATTRADHRLCLERARPSCARATTPAIATPVVAMSGTGEGFVLWTQDDTAGWISVWMRQHTTQRLAAGRAVRELRGAERLLARRWPPTRRARSIGSYLQVTSATMQLWTRRYTPGAGFAAALKAGEATDIDTIAFPSDHAGRERRRDRGVRGGSIQQEVSGVHQPRAERPTPPGRRAMAMETDNAAAEDDPNNIVARSPMPIVQATTPRATSR